MLILDALESGPLGLAALADVTALPRATAHRLAHALEVHGLVGRDRNGRFELGPRMAGRSLVQAAIPVLEHLRDVTGDSAQLFVSRKDGRLCVANIESTYGLRTIVPVGALLPLDKGSAGHVLQSEPAVLRRGWAQSVGEREKGVASVSAPVFDDGVVVAAVSVSGPIDRTSRAPGKRYAREVVAAARRLEEALGW